MTVTLYAITGDVNNPLALRQGLLFKMPGGEWHIQGGFNLTGKQLAVVQGASADDLIGLALWADAIHRAHGTPFAIIPYLPGARQDKAQPGEALSSKVYADLINSMELGAAVCLDPHSVAMACMIDRLEIVDAIDVAKDTLANIGKIDGVIAPDAGAGRRALRFADHLKVPLHHATKSRDPNTGKLSKFERVRLDERGTYLVVDDICDGGGTFVGLAEASTLPRACLKLWVTHGIFSQNSQRLRAYYSQVISTDSHPGYPEMFQPDFRIGTTSYLSNYLISLIKAYDL